MVKTFLIRNIQFCLLISSDTWVSDTEYVCHKIPANPDDDCERAVDWDVDEDEADLKCCNFSNRSTCDEDPYKFLNAFSVFIGNEVN